MIGNYNDCLMLRRGIIDSNCFYMLVWIFFQCVRLRICLYFIGSFYEVESSNSEMIRCVQYFIDEKGCEIVEWDGFDDFDNLLVDFFI